MLQVTKENAQKAHESATRRGRELLENLFGPEVFAKSIFERVKTFEDVCREAGEDPNDPAYDLSVQHPRKLARNKMNRILLICEVFQQGHKFKPNDTNERKWYPWFDLEVGPNNPTGFRFDASGYTDAVTFSVLGPLLWLPDEKTSTHVGKQFADEFKSVIIF